MAIEPCFLFLKNRAPGRCDRWHLELLYREPNDRFARNAFGGNMELAEGSKAALIGVIQQSLIDMQMRKRSLRRVGRFWGPVKAEKCRATV